MKNLEQTANRLINEKSPYLLQHAYNPVDWYPWGEKAFEKAAREDKPVFLSIGYSTCHWCHVMELESFEDEEVADYLNRHFVSVKVDREERPDIDQIYMAVCQAITGHGGWPLTIIMTPDRKPFFAGTYFPKGGERARPGLLDLLERITETWEQQRGDLIETGERLVEIVRQEAEFGAPGNITQGMVDKAYRSFSSIFDADYGGFGGAPKFPTPHNLLFLMRYGKVSGEEKALSMAEKTLLAMAKGGIYDHIGLGFTRYSTDGKWLVPHFEKMLYDNALLAYAYLEGYQASGNEVLAQVAREIFSYVLRNMTSPEGGFYSAEDADSEGVEGKFYLWSPEEVIKVLGKEKGKKYCAQFDIRKVGNFEGRSIPNLIAEDDDSLMQIKQEFAEAREELFAVREKRVHPFKDDKILTAWNGLMVAALAKGTRVLNDPEYAAVAAGAVDFIYEKLFNDEGRLLARYREGEASYKGYLDDYAFLVWGLLELYQTTLAAEFLEKALELNQQMLKLFWDDERGGFYLYGKDSEQLIARPKEIYDGAIPSGNSTAALNILRLARLSKNADLEKIAEQQLKAFAGQVDRHPAGYSFYLLALLHRSNSQEVVIAGERETADTLSLLEAVREKYLPFTELLLVEPDNPEISQLITDAAQYSKLEGKAAAYVCYNYTCRQPTTKVEQLLKYLQ